MSHPKRAMLFHLSYEITDRMNDINFLQEPKRFLPFEDFLYAWEISLQMSDSINARYKALDKLKEI